MNAVVFYSNTGQSKKIAAYFANKLEYHLVDIETDCTDHYQNLVLVFPVHCQNIPYVVKAFLKKATVERLTVIATYGKMCCGNVLYEIQNNYAPNIVAAAYVPTKHAYVEKDDAFCDYDQLNPIVEKIQNPSIVKLPKLYKNPFANLFPTLRSRVGLKIYKNSNCNGCNTCSGRCSFNAINFGKTTVECIRCLRCVDVCPRHALEVKLRLPLKLYLCKKKKSRVVIYI